MHRAGGVLIAALAAAANMVLGAAAAQAAIELGVRHRIDLQIAIEAGSSLNHGAGTLSGDLTPTIRISANSRESRYFGTIAPRFADLSLSDKTTVLVPATKVWEESACHQRRGLPKVTVMQLKGGFSDAKDKFEVMSNVRRIGLHVPSDELTPGIKLPDGHDDIGGYYALRAQTRDSRINVDLKIYVFDCVL